MNWRASPANLVSRLCGLLPLHVPGTDDATSRLLPDFCLERGILEQEVKEKANGLPRLIRKGRNRDELVARVSHLGHQICCPCALISKVFMTMMSGFGVS